MISSIIKYLLADRSEPRLPRGSLRERGSAEPQAYTDRKLDGFLKSYRKWDGWLETLGDPEKPTKATQEPDPSTKSYPTEIDIPAGPGTFEFDGDEVYERLGSADGDYILDLRTGEAKTFPRTNAVIGSSYMKPVDVESSTQLLSSFCIPTEYDVP